MVKSSHSVEGAYAHGERTSQTDDQRIKDVTPLPPPEHLIRFFPIAGTPVEQQIGTTRGAIRRIMQREDDRLLVIMGPCSIHDPLAAVEYAKKKDFLRITLLTDRLNAQRQEFFRDHGFIESKMIPMRLIFAVQPPAA